MHTKSYSEHLRDAGYCGLQWRILQLKPGYNERHNSDFKSWRVVPVFCNSKACPRCAKRYYSRLRRNLNNLSQFNNWRFFTLTTIHDDTTKEAQLEKLEENFRKLRKMLKRKFPKFRYIAVKELSPSGMWHYHGLWNIYIDIKSLSSVWQEISGAYRCSIAKVRNPRGAINYIFKYCFKSIHNEEERRLLFECDKRKFTTSRGLFNSHQIENPYSCEYGTSYSVEEIKEKLYHIISSSECTVNDFDSVHYPYFDDLIINLFHLWAEEHPPDLFELQRTEIAQPF